LTTPATVDVAAIHPSCMLFATCPSTVTRNIVRENDARSALHLTVESYMVIYACNSYTYYY